MKKRTEQLSSIGLAPEKPNLTGKLTVAAKTECNLEQQRYTTRRKQGGSQSAFDSGGRHAKSAGANLRRRMELALREEIRELLLSSWKEHIRACEIVFLAVSQSARAMFVGDNEGCFIDKGEEGKIKQKRNRVR